MADLATVDAPFGLEPWGPMRPNSCHYYAIETTPDVAIFHGDPAQTEGVGILTPHMGNLQSVEVIAGAAAASLVGVILGIFDDTMKPMLYMPITEAGNSTIAGYVLVCDDPEQLYIVQEDGDTSSIQVADIGLNGDLIVGTGDTSTGRSKCILDSSDVAAGSDAASSVKVLACHPEDTISAAGAASNYARFIVKLNTAYMASYGVAGI